MCKKNYLSSRFTSKVECIKCCTCCFSRNRHYYLLGKFSRMIYLVSRERKTSSGATTYCCPMSPIFCDATMNSSRKQRNMKITGSVLCGRWNPKLCLHFARAVIQQRKRERERERRSTSNYCWPYSTRLEIKYVFVFVEMHGFAHNVFVGL